MSGGRNRVSECLLLEMFASGKNVESDKADRRIDNFRAVANFINRPCLPNYKTYESDLRKCI